MVINVLKERKRTMKKIYFAPDTTITKIELQRMIAASDPTDQTLDPNEDPIEDESGIGSRRHNNVWDDEEEEDY